MVNVQLFASVEVRKCARLTVLILSSSNVNSVAVLLSGSVGVTPISVNHVTSGSVVETTFQESLVISFQSVQVKLVLPRVIILKMERSMLWAVVFVETYKIIKKISEKY